MLRKAQLALGRYGHLELRSNGGIEAGAGCRSVLESGEMEPSQVVVEVFGGHTAPDAQEGLDPLMQAVDGLDVQFATYPLASRLVQYLVGDLHPGGTACQGRAAVGDQQGVFAENGVEHGPDGVRAVHRQDGADDRAASVGRHQDRHLLMRQAPLRGLAAAPAGLAIRRFGSGLALFRALPGPGALIAEQHEGFIGLDNAGQDRAGRRGSEKAVAPAKGGAERHATALGRGDHRLAFAQRPAEVEPALLLPQPGQRRAGQRVEAPAASLAPEPPQSVGLAAADRRPVAAVRAAPFVTRARLDHRRYRRTRRPSGQHLFKLPALLDGQVVHLRKPRPKDAVFHHKLPQYATNSTMGSRTDLTRIEGRRYLTVTLDGQGA